MPRYGVGMGKLSKQQLDAMVEEATVDAYGDDEQTGGFCVMLEDNLALPFETVLLGVTVAVVGFEQTSELHIAAMCRRGKEKLRVDILDLPLPSPAPEGAEWIEAFRYWSK